MKRSLALAIVVAAGAAVGFFGEASRLVASAAPQDDKLETRIAEPPPGATLLPGLGDYEFKVTTRHPEVQRWFNQGLMLTYGFNHDAAERSFLQAAELDPECAMCWWGAALVVGPHVNAAMDPENDEKAWRRAQRALALKSKATERERGFIEALAARYAENPPADRRPLDEAYAAAAGKLAKARPDDLDAQVFWAEALMDLQPWDYYDEDLKPKGGTAQVVTTLERVIAKDPNHAGALHLYIHAVEASANPERGVAAADRLRTLIPGSGHLVHMPAHIYARVGRWNDAVTVNQAAIEADRQYLAACGKNAKGVYPFGYVPHNPHFLWFAASMAGESKVAREAARVTAEKTNLPDVMRQPGFEGVQMFWMTPWFELVRFGHWDEIAGRPNPAPDLPYVTAVWNYAQGMAAIRQKRLPAATEHHAALAKLAGDPALAKMLVFDRYPLSLGVGVAERVLAGELALARGDRAAAIAALREGARREDAIPYDEPPGWHAPVRHTLGAALLEAGQPAEAEKVYREELKRNPENGWSLYGLRESLRAQRKEADAKAVDARLAAAWKGADVRLASSRF